MITPRQLCLAADLVFELELRHPDAEVRLVHNDYGTMQIVLDGTDIGYIELNTAKVIWF